MFNSEQETIFTIITIIASGLLAFVAFLIFSIVTQKKVVSLQKKLLEAEILSIERERERVASDLHDSLGPTLSAVILLNSQIKTGDISSAQIKDDIDTYLRKTSDDLRQIARNIIPRFYDDTTVEQVVGMAVVDCSVICRENGIVLSTKIEATLTISKESNLHLYRIIQELLHNACKHSKATAIDLTCVYEDNILILTYHDNGIGYDINKQSEGLGLSNIRNRIDLLNGSYLTRSGNKIGTQMIIKVPERIR